jgi:hypothetical protein
MGLPILAKVVAAFLSSVIVVVPVGQTVKLKLKSGEHHQEGWVANDRVIDYLADLSPLRVTGKAPGLSPVVLTDARKRSQLFLVVVPKPK